MKKLASIKLPEWDEKEMRPKTKMPNCPRCDEDELGMMDENFAYCYNCGFEIDRTFPPRSVLSQHSDFVA